jgi:hypothetical protein
MTLKRHISLRCPGYALGGSGWRTIANRASGRDRAHRLVLRRLLTLMALGTRPELWAGRMAGIAVADWAVQYAECVETLRGYLAALFDRLVDAD